MSSNTIEFTDLEKATSGKYKFALNALAPKNGKVYVVSITRDGCPACQKQKPKVDKLTKDITEKYTDRSVFTRIHVKCTPDNNEESLRSKDLLGHYFYPTNLILFRTRDRGAIEYFRSVAPRMSDLRRNIENAIRIVNALEKQ